MSRFKKLFQKEAQKNRFGNSFGNLADDRINRLNEVSNKLLADRIIFLGTPIDDTIAQTVISQMLFLEHQSSDEDINLYINSPGGSVTASFAIYDTIKSINPDVATICVGQASGTAAVLLASGAKGKRFAQPSSRIVIYKPKMPVGDAWETIAEKRTRQKELKRMKQLLVKTLTEETNQSPKTILSIMRDDTIFSARDAIDFGFVDDIIRK
jgi:ATP-dependent Clp protease, protease subunit